MGSAVPDGAGRGWVSSYRRARRRARWVNAVISAALLSRGGSTGAVGHGWPGPSTTGASAACAAPAAPRGWTGERKGTQMAEADALEDYTRFEFTDPARRWTRPVYRRGSGPAVIVIHEMPGLHP